MAIQKPPTVIAAAQFEVLVGRDGPGDLVDGVRRLLERVPGVEAAEDIDLRNVRPGLNDVRLDVEARIRVQPDDRVRLDDRVPPDDSTWAEDPDRFDGRVDPNTLAAQLREGFGIRDVTVRTVDRVAP